MNLLKKQYVDGMKIIKHIFTILIILLLSYFIFGELFLEADQVQGEFRCEEFSGEWFQVHEDGTRTPIEIPGKYELERNKRMTVETTLPDDIPHNSYLCLRSAKQEMNLSIDGVLRQSYSTKDTRLFGKISAVAYIFLELQPSDAGKLLTLEVQTDSSYSGMFYTVYLGDRLGIWNHFFQQYGIEIIIAFFALILGMISIAAGIILRNYYHKEIVLDYLGWGVFIAAIWLVSNSIFRQLISPNLSLINDMAFLSLMLLPLPLIIYMNGIQKQRYEGMYRLLSLLIIFDFIICTLLHMLKWVDYTDTIVYMACVDTIAIIGIGISIVIDIKTSHIKEYFWVSMGILASIVAALVQMVMYFLKIGTFSGMILALGLIFLLIFATINTIHEILQLEREKQRALMSNEMKGKFLARMSHEIRTPINSVLGMNAMILRESSERKIKEYAIDIQNAGQNLLAIINDILDFSKIDSGKMEIIPVIYDFSSMIHDVVNMISIKAAAKALEFRICVNEELPSRLKGDDVRIRQILINLLTNAVKYTEQGTVTFLVDGEVTGDTAILKFRVEDTGIGIKPEDIEKLYQEFERIEEARNRNIEGTGLGMSIAVQLLELMGSKLKVESTYGKGSCFSFALTQEVADKRPVGNLEERIHHQAEEYHYDVTFTAPKAQLLIVDDNPINRKVFINLLKETLVKIDEAGSGTECLQKIREKKYDVIFLDHMMPDLDGIETLHLMKTDTDHFCVRTPVIALTANAISGAREMYLSEGFDSFISKPVDPDKLEKLLMETLSSDKIICHQKENEKEPSILQAPVSFAESEKPENVAKTESSVNPVNTDSRLCQIDGIDWEYALLHIKDENVLLSAVNDYYSMIEPDAAALDHILQQLIQARTEPEIQDFLRQYRIKVHAMKSSAALIGAVSLSGVAKLLEYAARDGRIDDLIAVTPTFLREWLGCRELLKPCIKESLLHTVSGQEPADYEILADDLDRLVDAMEDMDIDTADEIISRLKTFSYPEEMAAVIEELSTAVLNIDGVRTADCIQNLKTMMEK